MTFYAEVDKAHRAFRALQDVRTDIRMTETLLVNAPDSVQTRVKENIKGLQQKITTLENKVMNPEDIKGIVRDDLLNRQMFSTMNYLNTSLGDPGSNARAMISQTARNVQALVDEVNAFLKNDWLVFQERMAGWSWPLFKKIQLVE